MGPAASSLAGHIVCCLKRQGGELVVYTEKVPATPAPAGRGTNQKAMEEAAPATCLCAERTAHYFPQGHRWETGAGVWRSNVGWAWTLSASPSLLADDPAATCTGPALCCEVIRGKEPGLRVRCCRWLSQRQVLRSARWLLRSCPVLGLARCNRQTWLTSLQEAVAGSGCGDSGHAGSGHRGGGAAPSPYVGRKSRSIVRYCSRCRSRWLCGHSSSSSPLILLVHL